MSEIIKIKPNKDGKAIITLYGKEFDVTEQADAAGFGKLEVFDEVYQFEIIENSIARADRIIKKAKKETKDE